jgi:hypothetical protein
MNNLTAAIVENLLQFPLVLLFIWVAYRCVAGSKQLSTWGRGAARVFRFIVLLATLGLLAGCGAGDTLPVASGPLFTLNAGYWHPTAQNLASPPSVTDR